MLRVTPYAAAFCGVLLCWLGVRVSLMRMRLKVALGDGGNSKLDRARRVHANLLEHALPVLLLLLVYELIGGATAIAAAVAVIFGLSRVGHLAGFGLKKGLRLHFVSAGVTYAVELALSLLVLAQMLLRK